MPRPTAVLVEDNAEQHEFSRRILEGAGYAVQGFYAAGPALEAIRDHDFFADLFVLDRRLPVNVGELDADEVGDDLLTEVRHKFSDARIVVFTGFATIGQVQAAMANNGQIPTGDGDVIDRITVFQKEQSIEFKAAVSDYARILRRLNDIEVTCDSPIAEIDAQSIRVLKRVALAYSATSVAARNLGGGLSSSRVWSCELRHAQGVVASVVVKDVKKPDQLAGLASLLPASMALSTLATLSGLMNGRYVNVMRAAGTGAVSLFEFVSNDPGRAVELITPVARALKSVPTSFTTKRLDEVVANYIAYGDLASSLEALTLDVPSPSMQISVKIGWRHGDLHPANVLIVDGVAALIDFDSECVAGGYVDLAALQLSTLVHPDSPIGGAMWPDEDEILASLGTDSFAQGHTCAAWFSGIEALIAELDVSPRERWATTLAYAARQLQYRDVQDDPATFGRVRAIVLRASLELDAC